MDRSNTQSIEVNSLKFKAWTWWRSLSSDMKYTIINNPQVNIHYDEDEMDSPSKNCREKINCLQPFIIEQLFISWLTWDINGGRDND